MGKDTFKQPNVLLSLTAGLCLLAGCRQIAVWIIKEAGYIGTFAALNCFPLVF
jgi:hypothetical protein